MKPHQHVKIFERNTPEDVERMILNYLPQFERFLLDAKYDERDDMPHVAFLYLNGNRRYSYIAIEFQCYYQKQNFIKVTHVKRFKKKEYEFTYTEMIHYLKLEIRKFQNLEKSKYNLRNLMTSYFPLNYKPKYINNFDYRQYLSNTIYFITNKWLQKPRIVEDVDNIHNDLRFIMTNFAVEDRGIFRY